MHYFSTGIARHPRSATQWYHLLLLAAYGLATAHSLICIVNGYDSADFHFFDPSDLDLPTRARFLYSAPNHQVSSSYV